MVLFALFIRLIKQKYSENYIASLLYEISIIVYLTNNLGRNLTRWLIEKRL